MNERIAGKIPSDARLVGRIAVGGGTRDHDALINRDLADQHPIEAISGLKGSLDTIPPVAEALTNEELEVLLK